MRRSPGTYAVSELEKGGSCDYNDNPPHLSKEHLDNFESLDLNLQLIYI